MLGKNDFMTVEELKKENMWPYSWIAGQDLPNLLKKLGQKIEGIEIGVCRGENITYCLESCSNIEKIIAIDPYLPFVDWNGFEFSEDIMNKFFEITNKNFLNHPNKVLLLREKSEIIFNTIDNLEYDYIFIDGEHTYDALKRDLKNYYSKVKNGGLISGHDYNLPGISTAISDFKNENNIEVDLKFCKNDVWYWYKEA